MVSVLLIFMMNAGEPTVSDRAFKSFEECKEFVERTSGMPDAVNEEYMFDFESSDGARFTGGCVDAKVLDAESK